MKIEGKKIKIKKKSLKLLMSSYIMIEEILHRDDSNNINNGYHHNSEKPHTLHNAIDFLVHWRTY
jgi:hypothetical protein